ncbi:hypothetical protein DAQ1742_03664 [Dickeya aquatica]|uniref:Uncharacterized protein n=1 Tax=Dickeya aquatica TaxID=1401087 RepID=A0A375AED7_9GAMM|nr:hypothetical protein DAQ1742_03664 [Dickeya aquatica]
MYENLTTGPTLAKKMAFLHKKTQKQQKTQQPCEPLFLK